MNVDVEELDLVRRCVMVRAWTSLKKWARREGRLWMELGFEVREVEGKELWEDGGEGDFLLGLRLRSLAMIDILEFFSLARLVQFLVFRG